MRLVLMTSILMMKSRLIKAARPGEILVLFLRYAKKKKGTAVFAAMPLKLPAGIIDGRETAVRLAVREGLLQASRP